MQKYWHQLLDLIKVRCLAFCGVEAAGVQAGASPPSADPAAGPSLQDGKLDPTFVITHHLPLSEAAHAYKLFNDKAEGCVKVVLKPGQAAAPTAM